MVVQDLRQAFPPLREQEPLSRHTSWGIGGPADYYADVSTLDHLCALRRVVEKHPLPVFFLGAGSNVLVSDKGIRGLVIHLEGDFRKAVFDGPRVTVGAGMWMPTLVKQCAERGLSGIESLIGVPGTIGGGLVMNAGTREGVLGAVVASVQVLNARGETEAWPAAEVGFSYRHSRLEGKWITGTVLQLKTEERSSIMKRVEALLKYRSETQPIGTSNCGSVFKNPEGQSAGHLIEQAGLKGQNVGGAQVSLKHANFIINDHQATAQDVRQLIQKIQNHVREQCGIMLEPEVKFVGEW